jgi:hypothetical protein
MRKPSGQHDLAGLEGGLVVVVVVVGSNVEKRGCLVELMAWALTPRRLAALSLVEDRLLGGGGKGQGKTGTAARRLRSIHVSMDVDLGKIPPVTGNLAP